LSANDFFSNAGGVPRPFENNNQWAANFGGSICRCVRRSSRWERALQYGQLALKRPNPGTKVHLLMADLYSNSGNAAKAVAELEAFEKLDPKSPYIVRVEQVLPQLRQRATQEAGAPTPNPSKP
jgi:lipopolysaccharide biosynthesis regulator YciM